ncbi:major capsid protein [uncultured Halomonas sp.]|uniref:major capsid protein n=1 Tax=uncultured Halomonas sp. TaxID=173971 RepID=UPI002626628B|nr:major capsid protein [uncultured Halomonas sp.]
MATVQLADIYNPLTFARREQESQLELNNFIRSGVMVEDPSVQAQIAQGGNIGELTQFAPLGTQEPNYSNDNPANTSTPKKVSSQKMTFRLAAQNQSWSTMDLSRELALQDPVGAITGRVGEYWATTNEKRLIRSCLGILADNVANDGGDMLKSVATDAAGAVTDDERINADVVLDAKQTMGDHASSLQAIAMHSVIYTRLQKQNLIVYIPNARGEVVIPTYLGYTVIVDDSMPAVAGTNRITYTCVLFGAGAVVSASGRVNTPSEMKRNPDAGNGGGEEIIYSRRSDLIHPLGFSFTSSSVAGQSATLAELEAAANWNRVWNRKNVPLAFLQVND